MTDPDPRPVAAAATDPAQPVTIADIAAFTTRLARLRPPALGGDPAEYTALLAHKAKLLARIADQHARTDPAHAGETREITERAQRAVTARHTADAHDTTNVKDLQSPSSPGWGISLSNTGEFRRASSAGRRVSSRWFRAARSWCTWWRSAGSTTLCSAAVTRRFASFSTAGHRSGSALMASTVVASNRNIAAITVGSDAPNRRISPTYSAR